MLERFFSPLPNFNAPFLLVLLLTASAALADTDGNIPQIAEAEGQPGDDRFGERAGDSERPMGTLVGLNGELPSRWRTTVGGMCTSISSCGDSLTPCKQTRRGTVVRRARAAAGRAR